MYEFHLGRLMVCFAVLGIAAGLILAAIAYLLWVYVFSYLSITFS